MDSTTEQAEPSFWESLRRGFAKLREECAINPPLVPAGQLSAIWESQPEPGSWRLNYRSGNDGLGVAQRFRWHAASGAARLGFQGDPDAGLAYWLDKLKIDAPNAHLRRLKGGGSLGFIEILDVCGLSSDYCRKCDAAETKSRRKLAIASLVSRYPPGSGSPGCQAKARRPWLFPQPDDPSKPMWDSSVRKELHRAAAAEGCNFPGLGPHSFRRANITWRQEVGGSSIEASRIAGHATVQMTEEYTVVQLGRQEELTRRIQEKLLLAKERAAGKKPIPITSKEPAAEGRQSIVNQPESSIAPWRRPEFITRPQSLESRRSPNQHGRGRGVQMESKKGWL